jgi:ubiquinone/menaquinone biosynthesis C-methylase UbiE
LLQRTTLDTINKKLEENPNWKILDLGCGYTANKNATVVADVQDLSNFYKDKKFIKINEKKLPFKDKEFDFVITSHVIEHVDDLDFFIKEIERISNQGYIELPSKLGDNLVFENLTDHIWWFDYDDEKKVLLAERKKQFIEPFITVSIAKKLEQLFRKDLILELFWSNKIDIVSIKDTLKNIEQIKFRTLIKKYFSKKFRNFIR